MDARLAQLLRLLELERLELDLFRGESRDIGSPQVFGGQVLSQALRAAYATVDAGRVAHSLHAYFLARGDFNAPIVYFVDRSRDGHSFTSRRVTALQHGAQIFHLSASFQVPQPGLEHQVEMPEVPPPEALVGSSVLPRSDLARLPEKLRQFYLQERPFELRRIDPMPGAGAGHDAASKAPTAQRVWFRAVDKLPDDDALHRCMLAYVSDFYLLNTATLPHTQQLSSGNIIMASIDHAMWFHRPLRVDEWLLYAIESPSASGSRGFSRGTVFARDGRLVASTAQEGLIRVVSADKAAGAAPARG